MCEYEFELQLDIAEDSEGAIEALEVDDRTGLWF